MTLVLHLWRRVWQSVAFDTARGVGRIRWLRRAPATPAGWTIKCAGTWYAVWNTGSHLVFQAGAKQWPMTETFACTNVRYDAKRRFAIARDGDVIFDLRYDAEDRDDDPTFDSADLEQSDFFVWTERLWNNAKWKQEVVQNWTAKVTA
jgi:hypothetical protein